MCITLITTNLCLTLMLQIFKKYTNERGNIGMSQIAYGVGHTKESAIADAEKKLSS